MKMTRNQEFRFVYTKSSIVIVAGKSNCFSQISQWRAL